MNRDLFYTAYNAYLNGMIKQAWGGNFAAYRAQNAYSRGNQAMGDRLMNRAYRRGYPMGWQGQRPVPQQPQLQPPMQQPPRPMQQRPMPQPAPQGLPPARPQQPMPQQPPQNPRQYTPYPDESNLLKPTNEVDIYGRPLQIANLD